MTTLRKLSCSTLSLSLNFAGVDLSHPNKMRFKGVLVRLDEPSTKAPHGAEGHRIMVSSDVARKRLDTLLNMGVNYASSLDAHQQTRKVGVIEKAWIDGKDLCVSGTIWKHDFPEAQKDLKQDKLGMSMEIGEVHVDDTSSDVWELSDFYFMGATILYRNAAAYSRTHLIAAKADERSNNMKKPVAKKAGTTGAVDIAKIAASQEKIIELLNNGNKLMANLATRVDNLEIASAGAVTAADGETVDEIDTDATDVAAADVDAKGKKANPFADAEDEADGGDDEAEEDDMESAVDKGDLEELGSKLPDDEEGSDPGHINKNAKNHGSDTAVRDNLGKTVSSARIANLSQHVSRLQTELKAANAKLAEQAKSTTRLTKQVAAAAASTERRSYPSEILGLLAKSNLDAREISASGQKLTVAEIDAVLAASGVNLDPTKRMSLKNEFMKAGLMDEGRVDRGVN